MDDGLSPDQRIRALALDKAISSHKSGTNATVIVRSAEKFEKYIRTEQERRDS